jgi:His/Glu/Gln/Arg/opine family amino acid ABC transporter permease subunit
MTWPASLLAVVGLTPAMLDEWMPQLVNAAGGTLEMTALAFLIAIILGLGMALARVSRAVWLSRAAMLYIEIVRGIPVLTLLFLIYFSLTSAGIVLDAFLAASIGLGLNGAAYLAEVYRSGIEAVSAGQREAAQSIGMRQRQAMRYIVLPQAVPVVLPPLANYAIALLKDTSIASLIAAPEIMLRANDLSSEYFMPMQIYVITGIMYFSMAWPLSRAVRLLEVRLGRRR